MIFKVFFLISVVCLSQAFAGYEVGNGGSVVVCRDALNNILSVELLDIYEQRVKSKLSIKEFEEKYSESVNWYDFSFIIAFSYKRDRNTTRADKPNTCYLFSNEANFF